MTTDDKCKAIVQALLDMVNEDWKKLETAPRSVGSIEINGVVLDGVETIEAAAPDPTAPKVQLGPDWGEPYGMTIYFNGQHTHIGGPGCDFDGFVNSMYRLLCKNEGLSWA